MLATTSNFNGGNQPTNQLSQAQGGNGTSQIAESAPGTQTDLKQAEPVTSIPLNFWLLRYFEKFGWHKVDDICQKSKVKYTFDRESLFLNGNQKSVASVKKEVDGVLESLEILQEQTYCGKPLLPEGMTQKWIQTGKDKKCLILVATERSEKPVLYNGWVINTEYSKMHILYMMGSITLVDVDVILCPVTDKLEPIDDDADAIRRGIFFFFFTLLLCSIFFSYSALRHCCSGTMYWTDHCVIKFVSDLRQVGGFLRVVRFPPPIKLTTTKLLKVAFNTITQPTNQPISFSALRHCRLRSTNFILMYWYMYLHY
jgi:hypothetical protein